MQAARGRIPFAADNQPAFDSTCCRRRIENTSDTSIRIGAKHFILCLLTKQAGEPCADVGQRDDPRGAATRLTQGRRDFEMSAQRLFVAAQTLGHHQPEQTGFTNGFDIFIAGAPILLIFHGVLA
ncbi:hypothetical protein D3C76_1178160 [compost metagenome]